MKKLETEKTSSPSGAENIVGDAQNKCKNEVDCAASGYDQSQHKTGPEMKRSMNINKCGRVCYRKKETAKSNEV